MPIYGPLPVRKTKVVQGRFPGLMTGLYQNLPNADILDNAVYCRLHYFTSTHYTNRTQLTGGDRICYLDYNIGGADGIEDTSHSVAHAGKG